MKQVQDIRYGFLKREHQQFPPMVHVENTNICNIRCIHCPQADPFNLVPNYKPRTIDTALFQKVIDEVADRKSVLRMTPDGETLLPQEFNDQLRMIFDRHVGVFAFNTNGLLMEHDILETLLEPSQTRVAVEISLDALYRDSYDSIRVKSNFNRVLKNIFTLLYERNKRRLQNQIKVLVSIINQPELKPGEHEDFLRFWEPVVDKVIQRTYVDTKGLMPEKSVSGAKQDHSRPQSEDRWPCLVPFTRMVVTYDGSVRFCPDDWRKETAIGNIRENSIAELWQSNTMKSLRRSHLNGSIDHQTCLNCTDWSSIKWGYDYTVALNDLFGEEVV